MRSKQVGQRSVLHLLTVDTVSIGHIVSHYAISMVAATNGMYRVRIRRAAIPKAIAIPTSCSTHAFHVTHTAPANRMEQNTENDPNATHMATVTLLLLR